MSTEEVGVGVEEAEWAAMFELECGCIVVEWSGWDAVVGNMIGIVIVIEIEVDCERKLQVETAVRPGAECWAIDAVVDVEAKQMRVGTRLVHSQHPRAVIPAVEPRAVRGDEGD